MRLQRALERERRQENPKYEELCRRFLADEKDFSEEKLKEAGITKRFCNESLEETENALDINKLNHVTEVTQVPDTNQNVQGDGSFKFTLASAITDADLQAKVDMLLSDITAQGNRIAQHMDIRDMKKYRGLIRDCR